ncbi:16S rRNA (cytosine(967)-C(5))-methyltransferase RsmB [Pullulanibacillus sp. KACC 23026]|uniref:16S rRNA (cytosine(967)-C(5))-methyltransferase RsmB n=1 Tax=Pullulanibacillus sp. KACC 23026 TaxID=3028315 RepID=UPI0023B0734D|nr:16S rRNA (cytosine(967)-C(5))-methyltransferase RsmB [Pullulanibacillus sp. KACC 23026]WEG15000.1 16S rRNA (cytosine(967)-C(5))-methyltransferase RsmB [Pullulanibacillus sp. KACC 23026]
MTIRGLALQLIEQTHKQKAYSPLLLNQTIEKHQIEGRDAALLTQLVYGVLQRDLTLDFYLKGFVKPNQKIEDWVRYLLFLSIYQLVYLDRIPDHAIVSEAVNLAKKRGHKGIAGFVNGVLRNVIRRGVPSYESLPLPERLSVQYSHPLWLVERWMDHFGTEKAEAILAANNEPASVSVRVNPLKTTREEVMTRLIQDGMEVGLGSLSPDALIIKKGKVVNHPVFKQGLISIQDESSMLVGRALDVQPGMLVLDACAGPGGKTAHLAELMKDEGTIHALDLHKHKTSLIMDQANRLGLHSIHTTALDARSASDHFPEASFDRVLIDAPCTGFGVIRRKPEIKYTKSENDISQISAIQAAILSSCASLVKPGGKLVYSTCTIDREENSRQVEAFLAEHPEFDWDDTLADRLATVKEANEEALRNGWIQLLPSDSEGDGFFISCLVRKA